MTTALPIESGRIPIPEVMPKQCSSEFTPGIQCQLNEGHEELHFIDSEKASLCWSE